MFELHEGDCLESLRRLPDNSVDSLVTDPPAAVNFMQLGWDNHKGGRDAWVAWLREILEECKRVMKPGAIGFVWSLPRTQHWTALACEDAGFEIWDNLGVAHVQGGGFPKGQAIDKLIDKRLGKLGDREVLGLKTRPDGSQRPNAGNWQNGMGTWGTPLIRKTSPPPQHPTPRNGKAGERKRSSPRSNSGSQFRSHSRGLALTTFWSGVVAGLMSMQGGFMRTGSKTRMEDIRERKVFLSPPTDSGMIRSTPFTTTQVATLQISP
jgi:hypothetical protein